MMTTKEEATQSVRKFEEARKAEGYSDEGPTVLQRVPLMKFERDGQQDVLGFDVKTGVVDNADGKGWVSNGTWEASLEQRACIYVGHSPEGAIASMLHGVAKLAYDGSMHPDRPTEMGAPPIQHVLNILTDRLKWQTERREEAVRELARNAGPEGATPTSKTSLVPSLERHNQVIAALGTAVAALGRVNDL